MRKKWLKNKIARRITMQQTTNQSALRRKSVICHLLMDLSVTVRIRTENKNNDFCYLLDFSMFLTTLHNFTYHILIFKTIMGDQFKQCNVLL